MQSLRIVILPVLVLNLVALTSGQTTSGQKPAGPKASTSPAQSPAHKPVARKRYCQPDGSFCFKYPGSWTVLGEVFDGNGVVVAPQQKLDKALWDGITVALVAPEPEGDEEPTSVDVIIEQTSQSMREGGQGFETLAAPAPHRGPSAGPDAEGALSRESDRPRLGRRGGHYSGTGWRDVFRRAEVFAGDSGAPGAGVCECAGELGAA